MAAAMLTGAVAAGGALAESDAYIYGTMQIPYGAFYAAEGVASEVDAVTSATPTKWSSETLAAGTYSAAHEADEGGDILGVVYPVAITQECLRCNCRQASAGGSAIRADRPGRQPVLSGNKGGWQRLAGGHTQSAGRRLLRRTVRSGSGCRHVREL